MTIKHLYPVVEPSLNLDFANSKKLDPRIDFQRLSIGTYVGANGLIEYAVDGEARFDHDSDGNSLGLLVEESRANLFDYSVDVSQWTGANWTATPNSITAPDGTLTGGKVVPIVGTVFQIIGRSITWTSGVTYSVSFFAKDAGMGAVQIHCFNQINRGEFDLVNGTSRIVTTGLSTSITPFPNGWYKCVYIFTAGSTTTGLAGLRIPSGFTPDGVKGIYAWGFQVEASVFSSSYIPTSGSTVTRAADVVDLTNTGVYDTDSFTILNEPYGSAGGSSTLNIVGAGQTPVKRTTVYNQDLSQTQINTLVKKTDEFWRWRILGSSFALPSSLTDGQVTVDWGDGTVETMTTSEHTFADGGGYHDVGFRLDSGTYFRPNINNNASQATKVVAIGPAPESMKLDGEGVFYGCSNLKAFDATVDATGGTNLASAWRNCSSLTSFPLVDTSSGITFQSAWNGCSSLTSFPLIDTSSGTNFQSAWNGCSSLASFPLIDTSSGTNFQSAWQNCSSLTSFPLIDTSNCTNFYSTWRKCTSLASFPAIDTSLGTNFQLTWEQNAFSTFPALDFSSATKMGRAWADCANLTAFPALSAAQRFSSAMVSGSNPYGGFQGAWAGCTSLTTFPPNIFDDVINCTRFNSAFQACALTAQSIENILVSIDTANTSNGTLGLNGGTNAGQSTWTAAATTAYNNLIGRGWTISANA